VHGPPGTVRSAQVSPVLINMNSQQRPDAACVSLGKCPGRRWYERRRVAFRPDTIRLLLIAESPPPVNEKPGSKAERPFFYDRRLSHRDNLLRAVLEGLYAKTLPSGAQPPELKVPWLERLRNDGVYLIDAVPCPWGDIELESLKKRCRQFFAEAAVKKAARMNPLGVVVCHIGVYKVIAPLLRAAGLPLLHDFGLPFPSKRMRQRSGGRRMEDREVFVEGLAGLANEHVFVKSSPVSQGRARR
jgi:hypothetical protein